MKKTLLFILLLTSNLSYAQIESPVYYPEPNLNIKHHHDYYDYGRSTYIIVFMAGLATTTAAILDGHYQYGVSQSNPYNNFNNYYFWRQTTRQMMFCGGIGFMSIGFRGMLRNKKGT